MGQNVNSGFGVGFNVKGNPDEFNKMLNRQGELIRLIHAKKCPCLKNGKPDLFCNLCNGKGYYFYFQNKLEVFAENSPHGVCGDLSKINPYYIPIVSIKRVDRRLHESQGGLTEYEVESFDDTTITLVDNGSLPQRYERIGVTYSFNNFNKVLNENSSHNGGYILTASGSKVKTSHVAEALEVYGDVVSVERIYNKTKDETYQVKSFKKNLIYIDDVNGTIQPPEETDILEVDYYYVAPFYAALLGVNTDNAVQKWGEDVKIGDVRVVLPGFYNIGRGDIVTAMTKVLREQQAITRGAALYDELPQFDVYEIEGDIEDIDGVTYQNGVDFELREFNNLQWIGNQPAQGKKYTVNYAYRPSYQVYRQQSKTVNLGKDGRYPFFTFARHMSKFSVKELDKL